MIRGHTQGNLMDGNSSPLPVVFRVRAMSAHSVASNGNFSHHLAASASPSFARRIRALWHFNYQILFGPLSVRSWAQSSAFCDRLILRHFEEQRHYHTLVHIYEVIKCLGLEEEGTKSYCAPEVDAAVLFFAAIFHDAIYNPKSSTNEADSAVLFEELCSLCPDPDAARTEHRRRVITVILATAKVRRDEAFL